MLQPVTPEMITLDEFEEKLRDGERWVEVVEGRFSRLTPPDDAHGDVVRNLARVLAATLKKSAEVSACFELPLMVNRLPLTVRCPAVSVFRIGPEGRFAETDKLLTESCPVLVIEVASTNDRRDAMSNRVQAYLTRGVSHVWVIDPVTRHVHLFDGHHSSRMIKEPQVLVGHPVLPGFAIPVADLFRHPDWMKSKVQEVET